MNSKLIICPFCGGRVKEQVKERPPICPRCDKPLKAHFDEDHGGEYDICSKCGGMWMDRRKFRHATKEANVYKDMKIKGEYVRGPMRNHVRYASCVRCGKMMNRKNFRRISGVIIDTYADHGVWLDAGELEKIRHFIADGGLGKSRDREDPAKPRRPPRSGTQGQSNGIYPEDDPLLEPQEMALLGLLIKFPFPLMSPGKKKVESQFPSLLRKSNLSHHAGADITFRIRKANLDKKGSA